jgi:hypothetical protein
LEWELLRLWQLAIREIEMPSQTNRRNEAIAAALNAWHQTYDPLARVIPISLVEEFLGGSIPPSFADKLRQLNPRILSSPQTSRVGLIKLSNFLENSGALEHAVRQLENSTALIVDLRNNPGSTIEEARNILNIFLDDRSGGSVLFFTSDSRSNQVNEAYRATRRAITNKPLVVLIDATTKSVAELVAGVLQQTRRAWIIGDISFGKGTYVEPTQIPGSEALLYESKKILRYANGGSPQEVGVTPDFRVNSDVQTPRLIDLYVNVLPFQTPHFVQTRAADIQRINECVRCLERQSPQTIVEVGGLTEDATLQRALLVVECQQPRQNPPRTCR